MHTIILFTDKLEFIKVMTKIQCKNGGPGERE